MFSKPEAKMLDLNNDHFYWGKFDSKDWYLFVANERGWKYVYWFNRNKNIEIDQKNNVFLIIFQ